MWTNTNNFYCLVTFNTGQMLSNYEGTPILFKYLDEINSYIDEQELWGDVKIRCIHLEMGAI